MTILGFIGKSNYLGYQTAQHILSIFIGRMLLFVPIRRSQMHSPAFCSFLPPLFPLKEPSQSSMPKSIEVSSESST